uniref:Homeobox B4a n=1 Tax=Gadus morhua TaxID=8049 RepID=A0A8C5CXF9_GADMO
MAMSSYLINSNYVDPKFPPCEEYSQSDYLPSHSPDYYSSQRQEATAFQHDPLYNHHHHQQHPQRPGCGSEPAPFTPCQGSGQPASVVMSPRGHVLPPAGLQAPTPVSEQNRHCDSVTPSPPPPPSCGQTPHRQSSGSSPASTRKDPVVYPWMKKVHVNIVNPNYTGGEPKRSRTAYTRQQVLELEKEFHYNRHAQATRPLLPCVGKGGSGREKKRIRRCLGRQLTPPPHTPPPPPHTHTHTHTCPHLSQPISTFK